MVGHEFELLNNRGVRIIDIFLPQRVRIYLQMLTGPKVCSN